MPLVTTACIVLRRLRQSVAVVNSARVASMRLRKALIGAEFAAVPPGSFHSAATLRAASASGAHLANISQPLVACPAFNATAALVGTGSTRRFPPSDR